MLTIIYGQNDNPQTRRRRRRRENDKWTYKLYARIRIPRPHQQLYRRLRRSRRTFLRSFPTAVSTSRKFDPVIFFIEDYGIVEKQKGSDIGKKIIRTKTKRIVEKSSDLMELICSTRSRSWGSNAVHRDSPLDGIVNIREPDETDDGRAGPVRRRVKINIYTRVGQCSVYIKRKIT